MFQATASEVLVLKTIYELSKNNTIKSVYIEESELVEILRSAQNDDKASTEILNQVQNDKNRAQDDGNYAQNNGKHALEGCVAKCFVQKLEKDGRTFYKITENGFKQI